MVTYPKEVEFIQTCVRDLGFDEYTDEQIELAWRNWSWHYCHAGFLDPIGNPEYMDAFTLWGGFREPEEWEWYEMKYDDDIIP